MRPHAAALALLAAASPAQARFDQALPTGFTAHTLRPGEWQIGFTHLGWAPVANLEFSTLYWGWLGLAPNARVKWTAWHNDEIAASLALGAYYWNIAPFQGALRALGFALPPLQLFGGPLEAAASILLRPDLSLHLTASWEWGVNLTTGEGAPPALVSNGAAFRADVLWVLRDEHALAATWKFPLYAAQQQGGGTLYQDKVGDMQLVVGYLYSGDHFNLRVGLGLGRSFLAPGSVGPVFDLDIYWRLGGP